MPQFIPIFPLSVVVFPTERLNLHIFEDRYKQLINDCLAQQKPFGIVPVIDQTIQEFGTLIYIDELARTYEDGRMDVRTQAKSVFKILELTRSIPDKLYSGAIVADLPQAQINISDRLSDLITSEVMRLYKLLSDTGIDMAKLKMDSSFDIAHKIGLSLEEEYQLLQLENEMHRQEFIRRHLKKLEPTLAEMEAIKERIKMNGHFRELPGVDVF